jgi:hypothetical protein
MLLAKERYGALRQDCYEIARSTQLRVSAFSRLPVVTILCHERLMRNTREREAEGDLKSHCAVAKDANSGPHLIGEARVGGQVTVRNPESSHVAVHIPIWTSESMRCSRWSIHDPHIGQDDSSDFRLIIASMSPL